MSPLIGFEWLEIIGLTAARARLVHAWDSASPSHGSWRDFQWVHSLLGAFAVQPCTGGFVLLSTCLLSLAVAAMVT